MKKTLVLLFAALLVVAFALPASAFDSEFGGLWRTRFYIQTQFTGQDTGTDVQVIDTRTRLYYTAVFSDDFRFVNRFEFNVGWGDNRSVTIGGTPGFSLTGGGGIATDGRGIFRIKHSFADFRLGATRWTVGLQNGLLARGFMMDDDFAGLIFRYQPGTTADLLVPVMFAKIESASAIRNPTDVDAPDPNDDTNYFAVYPFFPLGIVNLNPYFMWLNKNFSEVDATGKKQNTDEYWLGIDADFKLSALSIWATGIYQMGTSLGDSNQKEDIGAYLLGAGLNWPLGSFGIHAEAWTASGDDDPTDDKNKAFTGGPGNSYYWSEIMGLGIFDNAGSNNSPENNITNIIAADIGIDWKPSDLWNLKADLWYAQLVEGVLVAGKEEKDLGTELDVVLTYKLIENMNLDLVGAYLFAGKATGDKDPYELGMRLQFTF